MATPRFSELSPAVQFAVIIVIGAGLWAMSEYFYPNLEKARADNQVKAAHVATLTKEVVPLRPFRDKVRALEADNKQLEIQLENLQHIVPSEKDVDSFIRLLQTEGTASGVQVRRITAKAAVPQEYYVEVPFEIELDGPYYDVLQFYDRLGKVERITNVSDLKMGGLQTGHSVSSKKYNYAPNETVVAVCTMTTFFSSDEQQADQAAVAPGAKGAARAPAAKKPPAAAPAARPKSVPAL